MLVSTYKRLQSNKSLVIMILNNLYYKRNIVNDYIQTLPTMVKKRKSSIAKLIKFGFLQLQLK